ncbi:MAG: hypothetical protein ACRCZF_11965 [Gemmataceae bacterium]
MGPIRVALCGIGFGAIGSVVGWVCQRAYLEMIGPAGVAHLPPGNSRGLHLLPAFLLAGALTGGTIGLVFGYMELRQRKRTANTATGT